MSLFLMDHSPAKIMILGRWSSDAFLAYIRPHQVLKWTNSMSRDMITMDSFFDVRMSHPTTTAADPRPTTTTFNGPSVVIPRFHLSH